MWSKSSEEEVDAAGSGLPTPDRASNAKQVSLGFTIIPRDRGGSWKNELPGVLACIDDLLVVAKMVEELRERLENLLQKLTESQLTISLCCWQWTSLD